MCATLYVVDEGGDIQSMIAEVAGPAGLEVETYSQPRRFLKEFDASRGGCLLSGVELPEMSGLELQVRLKEMGADIPMVFVAEPGDVTSAVSAMKNGAVDYLEKPVDPAALLESITEARELERRMSSERQRRVRLEENLSRLTPREREVMGLLVKGLTSKQIGLKLGLSNKTIDFHRNNILTKMDVDSVVLLVRMLK